MLHAREPKKKWKRRDFDLSLLEGKSPREKAEIETTRDLTKSIEQLVCDFHDMAQVAEQEGLSAESRRLLHAQSRMVSMMGRVALTNERTSRVMVWLTISMAVLTATMAALTAVNAVGATS